MAESVDDNNKIVENSCDPEDIEYEFNFINIPWDDRSKRSKAGIIALLTAIFIATMACVINNFLIHYKKIDSMKELSSNELNCVRVKVDDYRFVARIHSVLSRELLCVGAVVSKTSVLATGACVQSDQIRIFLGSATEQRCKKGFLIDVIESIHHEGTASRKLVLLSSFENFGDCADVISIGQSINWDANVHIIGRPTNIGRSLSRQRVTLIGKQFHFTGVSMKQLNLNAMICVKDITSCPVRAGDLLLQRGRLFGLAATSVNYLDSNKLACFADLNVVQKELKDLDNEIKFDESVDEHDVI
ncbi:uncharacterized protein LOC115450436 [Manduca sexta]|uniref:uncharacterized protein LOC115450436 n=1 Tax=Manduca sexta TaxID=7130 RepID=UPI001183FE48|nr:uncharacterized protein LOC115450436 [Manduca sexta]